MTRADRESEWAADMRAALAGDADAYRHFLQSVTPHLRAMARSNCAKYGAPASDVEDIVQETLLAIHLKRSTWDPVRPITPWISVIVRNKLIDMLRRSARHTVPIDDFAEVLAADEPADDTPAAQIGRLIGRLKDRQRAVVQAVSIEGCTTREAAARLSMSETGVRVTLHRALKALATLQQSKPG
ncbi:sigma-70 family RNA polymerase sigma factor [Ancylobacter sp. A5.8]|uniref:sigma-70 family RNA polymerase sigma factor n=1 Tax=Ancylobacter gelatini TaxID=2919920 RepID=UPI001F4E08DA|nr:sigma-70 family RNA polymerase sigma factor [Ancylobacter gelatini]